MSSTCSTICGRKLLFFQFFYIKNEASRHYKWIIIQLNDPFLCLISTSWGWLLPVCQTSPEILQCHHVWKTNKYVSLQKLCKSCAVGWGTALQVRVRGFDSRWCHWNFSLTYSFQPHYGTGVNSASNRTEYWGCLLAVKAASAYGWQPCHLHVPIV